MIFYHETGENVLKELGSDASYGLTDEQVLQRKQQYGENRLRASCTHNKQRVCSRVNRRRPRGRAAHMRTYGKRNAASLTVLRRDRRKIPAASSPFPPSPLLFASVLYVYSPVGKNMHCTRNRKRAAKSRPFGRLNFSFIAFKRIFPFYYNSNSDRLSLPINQNLYY